MPGTFPGRLRNMSGKSPGHVQEQQGSKQRKTKEKYQIVFSYVVHIFSYIVLGFSMFVLGFL